MLIGEAVSREGKVLHVVRRRRGKEIPVLEGDGLETGLRPNVGRIGTGMKMHITDSLCQSNDTDSEENGDGGRMLFMVEDEGGLFLFALLHYTNSNVRKRNTFENKTNHHLHQKK